MRGRRKAGVILISVLCLMIFFMAGCSRIKVPDDISVPAIAITSKGQVTAWMVESFAQEYYDLEELKAMVNDEVEQFNEEHKAEDGRAAVSVQTLEWMPSLDQVKLVMDFRDLASYREYTGTDLFYGTVTQAREAGYDLNQELVSLKDGKSLDEAGIQKQGKKQILIVQEKVRIYCPGRPVYVSSGVTANEDGSVEGSNSANENIYIIMR